MSIRFTRREFIKAAMGAAAVGMISSLPLLIGRHRQGIRCSKCGAVFQAGHKYKEGPVSGVYCPNCGVELSRLCYDVNERLPLKYRRKSSQSRKRVAGWEWAQVPFPNAVLIQETTKPSMVFSNIKL